MGGYAVRDKPIPVDRANDILKGEPKKYALQKLRSMKTAKGNDISYHTAPVSILISDEYLGAQGTKTILTRKSDETKFVTAKGPTMLLTKPVGGRPKGTD